MWNISIGNSFRNDNYLQSFFRAKRTPILQLQRKTRGMNEESLNLWTNLDGYRLYGLKPFNILAKQLI